MATTAFIFPGQGSQFVGMGHALADAYPAARAVFDEVDDALGERLSALAWHGPDAELTLTRNAQPALMAVSLAALRALETEGDVWRDVRFVAGHSLGEYSALAAAGSLPIGEAARLLRLRGEAMQTAAPLGAGAMAALLGAERPLAEEIAREAACDEICEVANDNGGGQVVISGDKAAVERAIEIAKGKGVRRAMLLPVSAPFHCRLMAPAAAAMQAALEDVALSAPRAPVVQNVTAAPESDPAAIRANLVLQVTGTVRWRECVARMADEGVSRFVEIGAGKVLTALMKRLAPEAVASTVGSPDEVTSFQT